MDKQKVLDVACYDFLDKIDGLTFHQAIVELQKFADEVNADLHDLTFYTRESYDDSTTLGVLKTRLETDEEYSRRKKIEDKEAEKIRKKIASLESQLQKLKNQQPTKA